MVCDTLSIQYTAEYGKCQTKQDMEQTRCICFTCAAAPVDYPAKPQFSAIMLCASLNCGMVPRHIVEPSCARMV